MPVTKVGVVYSKSQQVIRRIAKLHIGIVNGKPNQRLPQEHIDSIDEDGHFRHHKNTMHPNERWAEIDIQTYDSFTHPNHIHEHLGLTGTPGVTDRHAVIDQEGSVIAVVAGDPEIDSHPHGQLVHHPHAVVGDKIVNGVHIPADLSS